MSEHLFVAWRGKHLEVSIEQKDMLVRAFPHIYPLAQQFEICDAWLDANPRRRPRNQYRFLVNWFQKQPKPTKEARVGTGPSDMGYQIKVKPEAAARGKR